MPKFYHIDACCGGGKTSAMVQFVAEHALYGRLYISLQPTTDLVKATEASYRENGLTDEDMIAIHSDGSEESVTKRLHAFITRPHGRKVLLATIAGWKRIHRRKMKNWNLIVDEAPEVFSISEIRSKSIAPRLLDHLVFGEPDQHGYRQVKINTGEKTSVQRLVLEGRADEALNGLKETAESLLAGMKTYVSASVYDKFVNGKGSKLRFYHVLLPGIFSGFKSVTIMTANFRDSLLYHLWKGMVRFEEKQGFGPHLVRSSHPEEIGNALDIHYLVDDWSAYFKEANEAVCESEFRRATGEIFGAERFIYTLNSKDDQRLLEGIPNGQYVSPKAHGLNDFRSIHCAAIYAHFNNSRDRVAFLHRQFGIPKEDCWEFLNRDYYYQFVCRTSLRELPSAGTPVPPKTIIVMDKAMALYLQSKFPGSRVHRFQSAGIDGIPKVIRGRKASGEGPKTSAERTKKSRVKAQEKDLQRKLMILQGPSISPKMSSEMCNENTLKNKDIAGEREWSIALIGKVKADAMISIRMSGWQEAAEFLKEASTRSLKSKNKNQLFCLTEFVEANGTIKNRQKGSVIQSFGLLMDMDSPENCCPHAFADLFRGTEMIIYSSFSSSLERRRWRVVVPFSRPVTEKEYNAIAKDVLRIARDQGFGFDSKQRANDIMYLPGIGAHPEAFFFEHFHSADRRMLDVDAWFSEESVCCIVEPSGFTYQTGQAGNTQQVIAGPMISYPLAENQNIDCHGW